MRHRNGVAALPSTYDLDVGIIYTHERCYMAPLLNSLVKAAGTLRLRLILVDNAAQEGTLEWERYIEPTTVLRNDRRLGYARNLNRILGAASAPYVLMLNTDVFFPPREACLEKMFHFMDANPTCGVSSCRIYHPDGTYAYPARRFQTMSAIAARRLGLAKLLPQALDSYLYRTSDPFSSYACDWISGCFMFFRTQALAEVGGFDCGFSKYFEDVDVCARLARAGWSVLFSGATHCFHHEQRASKRLFSSDAYQHLRSYLRWLWKWGFRPVRERQEWPETEALPIPAGSS